VPAKVFVLARHGPLCAVAVSVGDAPVATALT